MVSWIVTRLHICYDLAKQLSQYLFSFLFSFDLFSYQWIHKIKVTHREVQDFSTGLGLSIIYIVYKI